MMRRILCYGDSNTYGYDPLSGARYGEDVRWPTRLLFDLGPGYAVVEEGFNGRTTVYDDPAEGGYKSGLGYLPPCLMSHNPLWAVAIMLGTNDLKQRFHLNAYTIAYCATQLVRCARQYALGPDGAPARVLLIAPPQVGDWVSDTLMAPVFGPEAAEISRGLAREYERFARLLHCDFLDAARHVQPSRADGVHLSAEGHRALAAAVAAKIREMIKEEDAPC